MTPLRVELSVLLPNCIAHVRVSEETRWVKVLVELIGLEPLRLLAEHVTALCHRGKNFIGIPMVTIPIGADPLKTLKPNRQARGGSQSS